MTMIERIDITDREQWLELRRKDVTASAAAALLGLHPHQTRFGLWAEKTGLTTPDAEPTAPMQRGLELEPIAIARLQKMRPNWIIQRPNAYYRDPQARLGATPDCLVKESELGGLGVVQIKSVEPSIFRQQWCNDFSDTPQPPMWIVIQTLVEAHLTQANWAMVGALVVSHGIELHLMDIPLHPPAIARVKAATADFWRMIEEGREPEPNYELDGKLIETLYAAPTENEIDLTGDNELPAIVADYQAFAGKISEMEQQRKALRAEILYKLGIATAARIATGRISAKAIHRAAYTVAASSFRRISFKENKA
jgi:hypothetical protein